MFWTLDRIFFWFRIIDPWFRNFVSCGWSVLEVALFLNHICFRTHSSEPWSYSSEPFLFFLWRKLNRAVMFRTFAYCSELKVFCLEPTVLSSEPFLAFLWRKLNRAVMFGTFAYGSEPKVFCLERMVLSSEPFCDFLWRKVNHAVMFGTFAYCSEPKVFCLEPTVSSSKC